MAATGKFNNAKYKFFSCQIQIRRLLLILHWNACELSGCHRRCRRFLVQLHCGSNLTSGAHCYVILIVRRHARVTGENLQRRKGRATGMAARREPDRSFACFLIKLSACRSRPGWWRRGRGCAATGPGSHAAQTPRTHQPCLVPDTHLEITVSAPSVMGNSGSKARSQQNTIPPSGCCHHSTSTQIAGQRKHRRVCRGLAK